MIKISIFWFSPQVTYPDVSLSVENASSKFSRLGTLKSFALSSKNIYFQFDLENQVFIKEEEEEGEDVKVNNDV
jgi:hypothetical protein